MSNPLRHLSVPCIINDIAIPVIYGLGAIFVIVSVCTSVCDNNTPIVFMGIGLSLVAVGTVMGCILDNLKCDL